MSRKSPLSRLPGLVLLAVLAVASVATADAPVEPGETVSQDETEEVTGDSRAWSGTADLGFSFTEGNSNTETFKARADLRWRSERSNFRFTFDGLTSDTADDRFRKVDPGITWEPGEAPPTDFTSSLVEPSIEPDVEKYYLEALFERTVSREPLRGTGSLNWHAGMSWERNLDAGLIGRTVLFAGVGQDWWDREDLRFKTRYSVSYTDRNERATDLEKDEEFVGARFSWLYYNQWAPRLIYENDFTFNVSLSNTNDYSSNMTQSLNVPVNDRWSLVVSLKWLFNNIPALEEIDIVAELDIVDPDGIPGNGDEFFQTVSSGGALIEFGTVSERKKTLDTVFSTSLRVTF